MEKITIGPNLNEEIYVQPQETQWVQNFRGIRNGTLRSGGSREDAKLPFLLYCGFFTGLKEYSQEVHDYATPAGSDPSGGESHVGGGVRSWGGGSDSNGCQFQGGGSVHRVRFSEGASQTEELSVKINISISKTDIWRLGASLH
jgi:hypothetical protein